jgi:thymidylate synthase (FAD)
MIRIITEPSVYLIARQAIDEPELARFLADTGAPDWTTDAPSPGEKIVETAGRLCYSSYAKPRPGGNAGYIGHILDVGHGSVIEHACWTVVIAGISRSLTHELIRHRVGISPSQLSQRFVDEGDCAFVMPPAYAALRDADRITREIEVHNNACYLQGLYGPDYTKPHDETTGELAARWNRWVRHLEGTLAAYTDQVRTLEKFHPDILAIEDKTLRRKRAREAARSVLPNATETKVALTGNARAWRHLIEMRGDPSADLEFVRLAVVLARLFKGEAPNLFADFEVVEVDGIECVRSGHRKV